MPHKVNPIHFENAEGNLKIAAGLFHTIGTSICLSRMQRDLTDSTILRNVGVACGHLVLAIRKLLEGLKRIALNEVEIKVDLYENTAVLMEFFQLKLRQWNITDGYNICKQYSRGKQNNKISTKGFIQFLTEHAIILDETQKKALEVDFSALLQI